MAARTADCYRETGSTQHVLKLNFKPDPHRKFLGCYNMLRVAFQCKTLRHTPGDADYVNMGNGRTFTALIRLATSALNKERKFRITASAWVGPSKADIKPRVAAAVGMTIDDGNCVTVEGPFEPVMIKLPAIQSTMVGSDEESSDDEECECCESESKVLFPGLVLSVMLDDTIAYVSFLAPRPLAYMQITQLHSTAYMDVVGPTGLPQGHNPVSIPDFIPTPPPMPVPALAHRGTKRKSSGSVKD